MKIKITEKQRVRLLCALEIYKEDRAYPFTAGEMKTINNLEKKLKLNQTK